VLWRLSILLQMAEPPSLVEWAQKELSFTIQIPASANKREFLRETMLRRVTAAMSCKERSIDPRDSLLSEAQLCRVYDARSRNAKRYRLEQQLARVRQQFAEQPMATHLPLPATVCRTLLLRPTETLFDLLQRINERCPSEYVCLAGLKARRAIVDQTREIQDLKQQLSEQKLREPGLREAYKSLASGQRTSDYASAQSAYLAQRPSLDEGVRALKGAADVHLTRKPAAAAKAAVGKRTTALKFLRAEHRHARAHLTRLLRDRSLTHSADGAKVKGFALSASAVSTYLPPPEHCVLRVPLAVHHLSGASAADYDASTERAFAEAGLDERKVINFLSNGAPTNVGSQTGALQRQRERTGSRLLRSGLCLDHTADLSWLYGLLDMVGRDPEK
jgi:hypothetical protein